MKRTIAVTIVMLLGVAFMLPAQESRSVRRIGIPAKEVGYKFFSTQAIESQAKLDVFLKEIEHQVWNDRPDFVKAIADAKIDFGKECLALIQYGPRSGSVRVRFGDVEVKNDTLVCSISQTFPLDQTDDLNYYCFALAVPKGKLKRIDVWHLANVLELDGK